MYIYNYLENLFLYLLINILVIQYFFQVLHKWNMLQFSLTSTNRRFTPIFWYLNEVPSSQVTGSCLKNTETNILDGKYTHLQ